MSLSKIIRSVFVPSAVRTLRNKPTRLQRAIEESAKRRPAFRLSPIETLEERAVPATLTWDANGAIAGQTDGGGAWLAANLWWDGANNVSWSSGDDAIFGVGGTGGAVTLASPTTVNSLTLNPFSGTYTLGTAGQTMTLNTGITMNAGAGITNIISPVTLGSAQSWTNNSSSLLTVGTGAVTNGGFLLTVGGSGNTTVSSAIGGTGGLTKTGAGTLSLTGANTFSGQVTVANGTLSIGSINNVSANGTLGNSSALLPVILGSSGNTGTLQYTAATGSSTKTFTLAAGGTGAFNITTALTLSGLIDGSGGLSKTGAGTLTLSQNGNEFTGNTVITNGKVALGAQFALWKSAYDTTGSTGAIGLDRGTQVSPWLGGLAGSVNLATAITGYGSITSLNLNPQSGSSVSYGGDISNAAMALNKTGHGTQALTGANSYGGATTVWAGTLALAGASGTALNSAFTVRGGKLELDNSGGTFISRLADATALSLGSLNLKSYNAAGAQTETVGATTFAVGGKVTITNGTTGGDQTTLALGAVTRSAGAAIDFVGVNGTLGGGANSPNVTSTGTFPGGSNGILPWATVNGTTWAGTASATSIVAYAGSFVDPTSAASNAADNAQLTGTGTIASAKSFNSLNVISSAAGQSLNLSANTGNLTLTSQAILKSGTDAYTISSSGSPLGNITAGTELRAHVDGGALTISAPLNTAIIGLAKGGTGDLILSGTRAGTWTGPISIAGGQLEFQGAGLTLNSLVTGAGGLTANLNPGQTLTLGDTTNSYAGQTIVKGGYLTVDAYNDVGLPGGIGRVPFPGTDNTSLIGTNLKLEGGAFYSKYVFNKDLGDGPNQIQILSGTSGIVSFANSGGAFGLTLDSGRELVWGSTYFSPTVFVHSTVGDQTLNLANGFDLAGSTRTILVGDATYNANAAGGVSQLGGVIRTSSGTAGLNKTGIGTLLLSGASTYNGATTVSSGTLAFSGNANVASANPLGQSSAAAANLLLANGTTLQYRGAAASTDRNFTINGTADGHGASLNASGTAAINFTNTASPAYGAVDQTRTLTLTGTNTNNNTLAANLANNGAGAVSVTKTGAGLWALSGTNDYTGTTTLTAGTLSVGVSANLGNAASNLVFNGGTLQVTGTGLTAVSGLGRTVSFTSGQTVGFDINNAANTFTVDQVLNQGSGGLSKAGAGALVLIQANTYVGGTAISAGTLQLNDGGTMSVAPLSNSGTLAINRSTTTTQGTNIPAYLYGTGGLTNIGIGNLILNVPTYYSGTTKATTGTITLSNALAIQNSALDTTGANSFILSGVTTPTFGGLSGATGDLASVITGYGSVTALTLNPNSGSVTYGGAIGSGGGLTLTKTGAGTQILSGANTYTGTTTINQGTLQVGNSTSGSLNGTAGTALTFNGTGTFNVQEAAGVSQGMGALTFSGGDATVTSTWNNGGGSGNTALTFASLTARSAGATGNFTLAGTGSTATNNRIALTSNTNAPLTTGSNDAGIFFGGSNYARYNATTNTFAAVAYGTDSNATTVAGGATIGATTSASDVNLTGAITAQTSAAVNTIKTGTAITQTGGSTLNVNGILTTATAAIGTAANSLQTNTAGGDMVFNVTTGTTTVAANIIDNGSSKLTKSGAGQLTLSGTNTYAGGTFLNAGTLATTADAQLGNTSGGVTVNGAATWNMGAATSVTYNRALTVNDGAVLSLASGNAGKEVTGVLSGNGTLSNGATTGFTFSNTGNNFTGTVNSGYGITFGNLGDSSNPINLGSFTWTGAGKTFASRPFTINAAGSGAIANNGTGSLIIQQPLTFDGAAGARTLSLGGSFNGANTFAGNIADGPGSVVSLTKGGDVSVWALSGTNTYTGVTSLPQVNNTVAASGGFTFQGIQALSPFTTLSGSTTGSNGGKFVGTFKILDDSAAPTSRSTVNLNYSGGNSSADPLTIFVGNNNTANGGNSAGTTTGSTIQLGDMTFNRTAAAGAALAATGANGYKLQINNVNISLPVSYSGNYTPVLNSTSAPLIVAGNVQQTEGSTSANTTLQLDGSATASVISGNILDSADSSPRALSLTKQGAGVWTLSGNSAYTGTTTVSAGTLNLGSAENANVSGPLGKQLANAAGTIVLSGGTLQYSAANQFDYSGRFSTAASQAYNVDTNGQSVTWGSNLTSSGGTLAKSGSGRIILTGTNTYSGTTTINSGELQAVSGTGLPTSSILQLRGGVLQSSGNFTRTVGTAAGNVNWSTSSGGFAATGAPLNLQLNNGTASVTWNGSSMVQTGQTLIFGSTTADNLVDFQNALNLGSSGSGLRTIQVNDNSNSTNDIARLSGAVTNTSAGWGILKTGAGVLEMTNGSNSYTGVTQVNAGKLTIASTGNINSTSNVSIVAGNFNYNSATGFTKLITFDGTGGTLSGEGTINTVVNVVFGNTLSPGNSIGTLTIANNVTLDGVSDFEVTGNGPSADKVVGINNLGYGGTLKITGSGFVAGDSWDLFDFTSQSGLFVNNAVFGTSGDGTNLPNLGSGLKWQFDYATGTLSVAISIAAPTVTSIVPVIGPTTGGTMVSIYGSNFVSITSVTFGGTPATITGGVGTTQINVTTPAHVAGGVEVVVTNAGGSGSLLGSSDFTYATPAVASVVVNGGPGVVLGGSTWSLAGQNSVVKQVLVTFNQAVTLASDAFTVTPVPVSLTPGPGVVIVNGGAAPSSAAVTASIAATLSPSSYLVTFSGPGTHAGGGINSGVYDLTTIASKVSANSETMASNRVDTFFAMFGTINANDSLTSGTIGDGFSNAFVDPGSLFQFSDAFGSSAATPVGPPAYNIVFDSNLDGFIDPGDLFAFSDAFGIDWDF